MFSWMAQKKKGGALLALISYLTPLCAEKFPDFPALSPITINGPFFLNYPSSLLLKLY